MLGAGLPLWAARETLARIDAQSGSKKIGPNDTIRLATIGTGDRCKALIEDAQRQQGIQFVAVCDVDSRHNDEGEKKIGSDVKKYTDFRELLQRDDLDAVIVATPDHWHTLATLAAIRKGLDVYCEKPLTLTIDEGKTLLHVAREKKAIVQTGSQQRSDARFRLACELVRNGRIGKVKEVEARIGRNPVGGPFKEAAPPAELDWDFWLGQTPAVAYIPERCHYEFRWWKAYSGGKMTDWGAHHNDITQWGLGYDGSGPISVNATADAWPVLPNCYDMPEAFVTTCTYDNGAVLKTMSDGENGILFTGENGWIFVNRSKITASDQKLIDEPLGSDATRLYVSDDHMKNFIDCVRSRELPICDVEVGHRSVTVCHLENIALNLRRELKWDPKSEHFVDDESANKLLRREMRAPWTLEG
jgi:myo-inositol 2-dehydrogenase / D-chiro-inositol 1-dehydrogenase